MSSSRDFLRKIAQSLEEEEKDIFIMSLYCTNTDDLLYFNERDRKKVKDIFKVLMEDTKRHADLLRLIVELMSPKT